MDKIIETLLRLKNNYWLILIFAIGVFLRFYRIDFQSLWLDEIFTLVTSAPDLDFSEIMKKLKIDKAHPPLYYFLVHFCLDLFGNTSYVLRMFSAVFGILGIFGIYSLGKELYNKNLGIIAAALLSINPFHIYYSQEGRMYSLLFFLIVFSFIFFLRFIKKQKNSDLFLYGLFISLAIDTQFYGVFILISQYLIFLFLFFNKKNKNKKQFLLKVIGVSVLILILIIPAFLILGEGGKKTAFQSTDIEFLSKTLKEFFGGSEVIMLIVYLIILNYFIRIFKEKSNSLFEIDFLKEKQISYFLVLFIWFVVCYSLPLLLSHAYQPILEFRFMIILLPTIVLFIAIGIYSIKNDILRGLVLIVFVGFSFINLFYVNDYYHKITKTQFREVSAYIVDNNKNHDPVISKHSEHFKYFTNDASLVYLSFQEYVNQIQNDSLDLKPFWFANAHLYFNSSSISESSEEFMKNNYVINHGIEMHDAWAKHYVPVEMFKSQKSKLDKNNANKNSELIKSNIEKINYGSQVEIVGWAFVDIDRPKNYYVRVVAMKDSVVHQLPNEVKFRPDVVNYFSNNHLYKCGFHVSFPKTLLDKGVYKIGVEIYDKEHKLKASVITNKTIEIE